MELSFSDFHSNDKEQFWKVVRHFVKSNSTSSSLPPLNSFSVTGQNDFCFSSEEKVDLLNRYFTSISIVNDDNVDLPAFEYKCQNRLARIGCTSHEIPTLMELLNPNKATGPVEISNKMLKAVAKEVSVPHNILFNRSVRKGKFSDIWMHLTLCRYRKRRQF